MSPLCEVDLGPFREAFPRCGLTVGQIARQAGMDTTHTKRLLRAVPVISVKKGKVYGPYPYRTCTYETAVKLARAMDLDPFEVGI